MGRVLEICVDTADGLRAAVAGGADRIELCAALAVGGLTPTASLMALAAEAPVPVMAMVRPREGDFCYSPADIGQMRADIAAIRDAGLAGIVLGVSRIDGSLDGAAMADLLGKRGALQATLHRAFDLVPDPHAALEEAVALGFDRVLTSGLMENAIDGAARIAELVARAAGRIVVMPGGGLRPDNVADAVRRTGAGEVHASAGRAIPDEAPAVVRFGFAAAAGRQETDAATVRALKAALDAA